MILGAMYALVTLIVLWWVMSKLFGFERGTHLAIFIPSVIIGVLGVTILGLLISTAFMDEVEYVAYWHSYAPSVLTGDSTTLNLVEGAGTIIELMWLPYAFMFDLARLWWYTMSTHLTIALVLTHVVLAYVLTVWWKVLSVFTGIHTLSDTYPDSVKRI